MTVSILIPFRGDGAQRDRLWSHCKKLWEALPYELCIGTDTGNGPFNIAKAFNNAQAQATGTKYIMYGADHLPDNDRIQWAIEQLDTHAWVALYAATASLDQTSTNAILAGAHPDNLPLGPAAPFCTAIIGINADKWIPYDERFTGWGGDDTAWRLALTSLYGDTPQPSGTLRCLYHEPASREHTDHNFALIGEYMAAGNAKRMPEYLRSIGLI